MTKVSYDENVKALLRASGMSDEEIRKSELKADQAFKRILNRPAAAVEPEGIERKFAEDDLVPLGR